MFRSNFLAGVCLFAALASVPVQAEDDRGDGGMVYTMTNDAASNSVMVYRQSEDGSLVPAGTVATGGKGTGAGLGSQGSLVLSRSHHWLLAVNAGSNDITVFRVMEHGLAVASRIPSGGQMPISITIAGRIVYVLNAGTSNNITGFTLGNDGALTPIANSTQLLSAPSTGPAEVEFSPDGDRLFVTEKSTNLIDVFPVAGGVAGAPVTNPSHGMTPYGFTAAKRDRLFVSEASGGATNASAASSYSVQANDTLRVISGSVPTNQTAACWLVINASERHAYTTNTGSRSVSLFRIGQDGSLTLTTSLASTPAGDPIDPAFSAGGRFLNVLTTNAATIVTFRVHGDGTLTMVGTVSATSAAAGLAGQ